MAKADTYEVWRAKQTRRVRRIAAVLAGLIVLGVAFVCVTVFVVRAAIRGTSIPSPASVRAMVAGVTLLPGLFLLAPIVVATLHLWQQWTLLKRVPAHAGLVCPLCRRPLDLRDGSTWCPRCRAHSTAADVRRYWEQYLLPGLTGLRWRREFTDRYDPSVPAWIRGVRETAGRRPGLVIAIALGGWIVLIAAFALLGPSRPLDLVTSTFPILLLTVGLVLVAAGARQRVGTSEHCAACGYERGPDAPDAGLCPECGAEWGVPGGTAHGRLRRRPALTVAGAFLLGLFLVQVIAHLALGPGAPRRLVPSSLLIASITASDRPARGRWRELLERTLTPEQEDRLARGLVEKRQRGGRLAMPAEQWFHDSLAAGLVPAAVADGYFDTVVAVVEVGPARAVAGRAFTPYALLDVVPPRWQNQAVLVLIEDVQVDGAASAPARGETPVLARNLGQTTEAGPRRLDLPLEITPERGGPLRLRVVLWRLYGPTYLRGRPVAWGEEGEPDLLPSVTWADRLEVEHVIRVEPAAP